MKSPYDIILRPVLSEKTYDEILEKRYTFYVALDANKIEIREAVEKIFDVKVANVNTSRRQGKIKKQGRTQGRTPETKKAYVTLKPESKSIAFFDDMAQ